jgi:hypothetical protein
LQHYRSKANEKAEPQPAPAESPSERKAVFGVQICKTLRSATGEEQMSEDHEEIWLECKCGDHSDEGRQWCEDDVFDSSDHEEGCAGSVRYVRADLHEAAIRERDEARAERDAEQKTGRDLYRALNEALEEKSKLMSERDEARAELADLKRKITEDWVSVSGDMPGICGEAEARGFERGVKDAAKVVEVTADKFSSERTIRTILALLEPVTLQKPEA